MSPMCALLDGLSADEYRATRKIIIGMILATDLSQHFDDMTRFKTRLQNGQVQYKGAYRKGDQRRRAT